MSKPYIKRLVIIAALLLVVSVLFIAWFNRTADVATKKMSQTKVSPSQSSLPSDNSSDSSGIINSVKLKAGADLGINPGTLSVLEVKSVQWSDSSLGCPKPDMMYSQVVTPGWEVKLKKGDTVYDYHTDQSGDVIVLCEQ